MQLRKPAIWIATASPFALYALFAGLGSDSTGLPRCRYETSPMVWMVDALGWFTPVLPMIFGIVLADRLVRHRKLWLGLLKLSLGVPASGRDRVRWWPGGGGPPGRGGARPSSGDALRALCC
jgi:hypothetical protein